MFRPDDWVMLLVLLAIFLIGLILAYKAGQATFKTPVIGTLGTIEALPVFRFNDQGGGVFTATVGQVPGLKRGDGTPAQKDDVLSIQPDGTLELRAAGMNGAYERCTKASSGLMAYRPIGEKVWLVPYATQLPN